VFLCGTRQTTSCPSGTRKKLGKIKALGKVVVYRVFFFCTIGKQALCRVFETPNLQADWILQFSKTTN